MRRLRQRLLAAVLVERRARVHQFIAVQLQKRARGFSTRRAMRRAKEEAAANTLQRAARQILCRHRLLVFLQALVFIQARIRRKIAVQRFSSIVKAVRRLQSLTRTFRAKNVLRRCCQAIVTLQCMVRKQEARRRRSALENTRNMTLNAIKLQAKMRARLCQSQYTRQRGAAIYIQVDESPSF